MSPPNPKSSVQSTGAQSTNTDNQGKFADSVGFPLSVRTNCGPETDDDISDNDSVAIPTPTSPTSPSSDMPSGHESLVSETAEALFTWISFSGYDDAPASMPTKEHDPRGFVLFVLSQLRSWLIAFKGKKLPRVPMSVYFKLKQKAEVMTAKVTAYKSLLVGASQVSLSISGLESHDTWVYADVLSRAVGVEEVETEALGGIFFVEMEQTAWHEYIMETGRLDEYVTAFVDEQKACRRKPSKLTDVAIKIMSKKFPDGSHARDIVNSLLSCNRRQNWEQL